MTSRSKILVVDDNQDDRDILEARLADQGYHVATAVDGLAALAVLETTTPDLILLDQMMPRLDGIATLKRMRTTPGLASVPVIMLTAKGDVGDVIAGLDAGANEYLVKPVDHAALTARVRAMLRLKAMHDELADLNDSLNRRVTEQVAEIGRISRLKQFLAPQIVHEILASPDGERVLESHRREVAVLFCDLRGFTSFAESAEPEEVMELLRAYHNMLGDRIFSLGGTLERFAGDAVMVLFNDPVAVADYCQRAVRLALEIVDGAAGLLDFWRNRGAELGVGIGIAAGVATLGKIGFSERFDYAAIGTVTNLASRLSAEAESSQILATARIAENTSMDVEAIPLGHRQLKGFSLAVPVFALTSKKASSLRPDQARQRLL